MLTLIFCLVIVSTLIGCIATIPNYRLVCELYILSERLWPSKQNYYKCAMIGNEAYYWLIVAKSAKQAKQRFADAVHTNVNQTIIIL